MFAADALTRTTEARLGSGRDWQVAAGHLAGDRHPALDYQDWLAGRVPNGGAVDESACSACGAPQHRFDSLPPEYVYLLGLYLGDACISAHTRGVYRLRVFFDARYPEIIAGGEAAVRSVFPANRINRLSRSGGNENSARRSNVELSVYSKALPCLFPQHGPGRKHERRIALEDWQRGLVERHLEQLLRGLIHSDGCRFFNTGRNWRHPRYSFSNHSQGIRAIFCDACDLVGAVGRRRRAPSTSRACVTSRCSTSSSGRRSDPLLLCTTVPAAIV